MGFLVYSGPLLQWGEDFVASAMTEDKNRDGGGDYITAMKL